jgi:hypothetical protein
MNKAPRALGIYLCKRIAVDPKIGEMSLVGLFTAMTFGRFPTPNQHFTIYAMLYDGFGEGIIEERIVQLDTEREVYRHQRWAKFLGRGTQSQYEAKVTKCRFNAPGRYSVELRFDERIIDSRVLDVFAS